MLTPLPGSQGPVPELDVVVAAIVGLKVGT